MSVSGALTLLLLLLTAGAARASMQMLGLGGGGSGMVKGSSFNLDTKERVTRVHGTGIKLDLELLEVVAAGGSILYSPTHVEYKKGLTRWMQTFSDGKLSLHHNDKTVLQLYTPDESPYYLLSMRQGNAAFRDLILDKALSNAVAFTLCIVDSVFDDSLTQASCEVRADSTHLTVSQSMEGLAKSLLYVSEFVASAQKNILEDIISAVQSTLVKPLQGEVSSTLGDVRSEVGDLQKRLRGEYDDLKDSLHNSEVAMNATLSALIGEVAEATTVTLASISSQAHLNLTNLEKAVFLHFVEFNKTYGELLDVTVLQLEKNLTFLSEEVTNNLRLIFNNTLPALHTRISNETMELLNHRFASFGEETNASTSRLFNIAVNFSKALGDNMTSMLNASQEEQFALVRNIQSNFTKEIENSRDEAAALRTSVDLEFDVVKDRLHALQENVTSVAGSLDALSLDHAEKLQKQSEIISAVATNLTADMTVLKEESLLHSNAMQATIEGEIGELRDEASDNVTMLMMGLERAGQQIFSLEQNSSMNLAKSNSILAQAVGEVNKSLTLLGTASGGSFSRLENNLNQSIAFVLNTLNVTTLNISKSAESKLSEKSTLLSNWIRNATLNLSTRVDDLNNTATQNLEALNTSLREEVVKLEGRQVQALSIVQKESDANLTHKMNELNSSFFSKISFLNESITEQVAGMNISAKDSVHHLAQNTTSYFTYLQKLVVDLAREVYSPLEIDYDHPDLRQPPVQDEEKNRYQRIDRAKKGKSKQKPPAIHFVNEELRVEADNKLLELLDHEHGTNAGGDIGNTLSRSAVIEKNLHLMQLDVRKLDHELRGELSTTNSSLMKAIQDVHATSAFDLGNVSQSLQSKLMNLSTSLQNSEAGSKFDISALNSSLMFVNASLTSDIRKQADSVYAYISTMQAAVERVVDSLSNDIRRLGDEVQVNTSLNYNQLEAQVLNVSNSLSVHMIHTDKEFNNLSSTLWAAWQLDSLSLNQSMNELDSEMQIMVGNVEKMLLGNASFLLQEVEALNYTSGEQERAFREHVAAVETGLEDVKRETLDALTNTEYNLDARTAELRAETVKNITELRQSVMSSVRLFNSSQQNFEKSIAAIQEQYSSDFDLQEKRRMASYQQLDEAVKSASREFQESNTSLAAEIAALSTVTRDAILGINKTQSELVINNHAKVVEMMDMLSVNTTNALKSLDQNASDRIQAIGTDLANVKSITDRNISHLEKTLRNHIHTTTDNVIANSTAALNSMSGSLLSTLESSLVNVTTHMKDLSDGVLTSLKESMKANEKQLELFSGRMSGRINLTDHRITQTEDTLKSTVDNVNSLQKDIVVLYSNESHAQSNIARLEDGLIDHAKKLWELANVTASSSTALTHLNAASSTTIEHVRHLDSRVDDLASNFSQRTVLLDGVMQQTTGIRDSFELFRSTSDTRLSSVEEDMKKHQRDIGSIQVQLGGNDFSLTDLRLAVESVDSKADSASRGLTSVENTIKKVQDEMAQSSKTSESLERRLSEVMENSLPTMSATIAELATKSEISLEKLSARHQHTVDTSLAAAEDKLVKMEQRLAISELMLAQQEKRLEALMQENEALKRTMATQDNVDDLRKLLQDLQASMIAQSSKVLDLIVANLGSK